ncbi:MAG: hypothetical protein OHK0046_32490 [Anaerolineae bacterium]
MGNADEIERLLAEEEQPQPRGLSLGSIMLLAGVLVSVAVIGWAFFNQQSQTQPTRGRAPDFTLTTFEGETFTLSEQRGQVVVLNFWGSWCAPCRAEAPDLQRVYETYRDQGVVVLGVTYLDEPEDSLAFIRELGLTYPNGTDPGLEIAEEKYHIDAAPETFVIDRDGNVAYFFYGPLTAESLSTVLDDVLAGAI